MRAAKAPDDILVALLERGVTHCREILVERREDSLMPFYHLITRSGEHLIVGCPWRNDPEKYATFARIKRLSREEHCTHALFVSEGWMAYVPAGKDPMSRWPAAEQPDRIEIIQAVATDGSRIVSAMARIERDKPGGRIVDVVRFDDGSRTIGGAMIDDLIASP